MDYQRFIGQLPELSSTEEKDLADPKSTQIEGINITNLIPLLNFAVACLESSEVYCEIGCSDGTTLIGALLNHPEKMGYAVDNFSEFDPENKRLERLTENLAKFGLEEQVLFCNQTVEEFFFQLREIGLEDKIGVYFYNSKHDYRSQLLGLLLVRPFLADQSVIMINNSNWGSVQQATWDFIAANPQCQLVVDLSNIQDADPLFGHEIQILSWDQTRISNYEWTIFCQIRNQSVVRAIYSLSCQQNKKALASLYQAAIELHQQGHLTGAEEKYHQFIQWDENNFDIWYNLGMLYYTTNRYSEAINALYKALEIDASKALVYYGIGMVLQKMEQNLEAIAAYEKAIEIDPNYIDAYNNLGNIWYRQGDAKQAEKIYRQALTVNPEHFGSYLNLGNALKTQYRLDEAIATYKKARDIIPDDPDLLHNIATISIFTKQTLSLHLRSGLIVEIENQGEWDCYDEIFLKGEYDLPIKQALSTKHQGTFKCVDLGANVGFFSMRVTDLILQNKNLEISLQINLIEGSPTVYSQLLSRLAKINLPDRYHWQIFHGLVGVREGKEKIFESDKYPVANSIFKRTSKYDDLPVRSIEVPYIDLTFLENENSEIDLLKCDVEGAELLFIENYPNLLSQVKYAVFELHYDDCDVQRCLDVLKEIGFINQIKLRDGAITCLYLFSK